MILPRDSLQLDLGAAQGHSTLLLKRQDRRLEA